MVLKTIDLQTTPTSLEELLALLQDDTEILITKDNVPLARLSPVEHSIAQPKPRIPGLNAGTTLWISEDFDDPLPDEFWLGDE